MGRSGPTAIGLFRNRGSRRGGDGWTPSPDRPWVSDKVPWSLGIQCGTLIEHQPHTYQARANNHHHRHGWVGKEQTMEQFETRSHMNISQPCCRNSIINSPSLKNSWFSLLDRSALLQSNLVAKPLPPCRMGQWFVYPQKGSDVGGASSSLLRCAGARTYSSSRHAESDSQAQKVTPRPFSSNSLLIRDS